MNKTHSSTPAGRIHPTPLMRDNSPGEMRERRPAAPPRPAGRVRSWFRLLAVLGPFVLGLGGSGALWGAPPAAIDIAAGRVVSALAEGVAITLNETPQDERGLVMIGAWLDDVMIKAIQQSPLVSRSFVDKVALRYPLSTETKKYITGALIGLSEICRDFPPPPDSAIDPSVLKLILAFRQGVKAGVESHRLSGNA